MRAIWTKLVLAMVAAPLTVASTTPGANPPADYIHNGSGFVFPLSIGSFQRSVIQDVTPDGLHIAAQYDDETPGHELMISVEIYPAPHIIASARTPKVEADTCADQASSFDREMQAAYEARRLERGTLPSPSPHHSGAVWRSLFKTKRSADETAKVETYLFCRVADDWMISYIANGPPENDVTSDLARFAAAFPWSQLKTTAVAQDRRTIMIVRPKSATSTYLLRGLVLSGDRENIDRFQAVARPLDITISPVEGETPPMVLVEFGITTKALAALELVHRLRTGDLGPFTLEYMLLPLNALNKGGDEADLIEVVSADAIEGL